MKSKFAGGTFLVGLCLLCGILLLIFGIKNTSDLKKETENYAVTEGYLSDYELRESGSTTDRSYSYYLTYSYVVDGREYTVTTDYGSGSVPEMGSTKEIKYNPQNPEEAVIAGMNGSIIMIFMGVMFILIPGVFIMGFLTNAGVFEKCPIRVFDLFIGLVPIVIGLGAFYLMADGFSFKAAFAAGGPFALIPILLIAAGVFIIAKNVFPKKDLEETDNAKHQSRRKY